MTTTESVVSLLFIATIVGGWILSLRVMSRIREGFEARLEMSANRCNELQQQLDDAKAQLSAYEHAFESVQSKMKAELGELHTTATDLTNQCNQLANFYVVGTNAVRELLWIAWVFDESHHSLADIIAKARKFSRTIRVSNMEESNARINEYRKRCLEIRQSAFADGGESEGISNLEKGRQ